MPLKIYSARYYTIPSDNRELQHRGYAANFAHDYTIPSDNRELQLRTDNE